MQHFLANLLYDDDAEQVMSIIRGISGSPSEIISQIKPGFIAMIEKCLDTSVIIFYFFFLDYPGNGNDNNKEAKIAL